MPRDTLFAEKQSVMMITIATAHKNKERGRPREFDIEQALDHAMIVLTGSVYL
jgi:TetR/AcrR family transcriptional repressor of nem operon